MQTFLPQQDFILSAEQLDKTRLNKQIVETQQILNCLLDNGAWSNHPAVRMWRGFEPALVRYAHAMMTVWVDKYGGKWDHKSWQHISDVALAHSWVPACAPSPDWLGDERLHSSHRSRLLLKGELDTLRARALIHFDGDRKAIKTLIMERFNLPKSRAELRDLTVERVNDLNDYFDSYDIERFDNWYNRFGWAEVPTDDYFWPVELLT